MITGEFESMLPHLTAFYGIRPWEAAMMSYGQMVHYLEVYHATVREINDNG